MIEIRQYQDSDLEPLLMIMNEIAAQGDAFVYDCPFTPEQLQDYIRSYAAAFVAVRDGRTLGAYVLKPNRPGRGSHVANASYMIATAARGYGIGKLLGEHSLSEAKRLGFAAIQFNAVVSTNASAVALWRRLGFNVVGTVPQAFRHADGRLVDLHIMHRFV